MTPDDLMDLLTGPSQAEYPGVLLARGNTVLMKSPLLGGSKILTYDKHNGV